MQQSLIFLKSFFKSPKAVGSMVPSSRFLVNAMLKGIDWSRVSSVAELGAGTGVVTAAIEERRRRDAEFLCFERDAVMRTALEKRYNSVVFHGDAFDLRTVAASRGLTGLDCVVSGLPLANFSRQDRRLLLEDIHDLLNPGGTLMVLQFTRQVRPSLDAIFGKTDTIHVWANVPPAFVYICKKKEKNNTAYPGG